MNTRNSFSLLLAALVFLFIPACASEEEPVADELLPGQGVVLEDVWSLDEGLDRPESAIYDPVSNAVYVSNLVGDSAEMDGNGYVAKVSTDGDIIEERWVEGLNAPKGMALRDNELLVSDINALVVIDIMAAEVTSRMEVEGDVYLNDVAVGPDGSVFVSDSRYSKVYTVEEGTLVTWFEDSAVQMPNGLHVMEDALYIVAGDSASAEPGSERYLQRIDLADRSVEPVSGTNPEGTLDAVEPDGRGGIFITDWASGRLMHFTYDDGYTELRQLGQGAADVEFVEESSMLYAPVMMESSLKAYDVSFVSDIDPVPTPVVN